MTECVIKRVRPILYGAPCKWHLCLFQMMLSIVMRFPFCGKSSKDSFVNEGDRTGVPILKEVFVETLII